MKYKISELVAKTNVPKSTILYYIKEGMLPQAHKIKSNVHRYTDEHIERIKYINYMKEHLGSSNEQLKHILQNNNQSFASLESMITPLMNSLSDIPLDTKHYTKEAFVSAFNVDKDLLNQLLEDEILIPTNDNDFTDKEASIIQLVQDYREVGIKYDLLKMYVFHAKALSMLEHQIQTQLCDIRNEENFSILWKIVFETLFNVKTYIFNRQTYKAFFSTLKKEVLT